MLKESVIWTLKLFFDLVIVLVGASIVKTVLVFLISRLFGYNIANMVVNIFTWPGVVVHELSHAIGAFITGAKVINISFLPRGNTLGHVDFALRGGVVKRSIQGLVAGVAPSFVCTALACYLAGLKLDITWQSILRYYLIVCCLLHCELSGADLRVAIGGVPFVFILVIILRILYMIFSKKPG